jgi:hypothetical protein
VIGVLVVAAIVGIFIWRCNSPDESNEERGEKATEMDEWTDFTPSSLSVTEFIECENILATEARLDTFGDMTIDETGFLNLT